MSLNFDFSSCNDHTQMLEIARNYPQYMTQENLCHFYNYQLALLNSEPQNFTDEMSKFAFQALLTLDDISVIKRIFQAFEIADYNLEVFDNYILHSTKITEVFYDDDEQDFVSDLMKANRSPNHWYKFINMTRNYAKDLETYLPSLDLDGSYYSDRFSPNACQHITNAIGIEVELSLDGEYCLYRFSGLEKSQGIHEAKVQDIFLPWNEDTVRGFYDYSDTCWTFDQMLRIDR